MFFRVRQFLAQNVGQVRQVRIFQAYVLRHLVSLRRGRFRLTVPVRARIRVRLNNNKMVIF